MVSELCCRVPNELPELLHSSKTCSMENNKYDFIHSFNMKWCILYRILIFFSILVFIKFAAYRQHRKSRMVMPE